MGALSPQSPALQVPSSQDTRFDPDLDRFRKIIKLEFEGSHKERGWMYDEMIDRYSHDDLYRNIARSLIESYDHHDLLTPVGKINPDETIYRDNHGRYLVDGGVMRMGGLGKIFTSLLQVYVTTKDKVFLDRATDMLDALSPQEKTRNSKMPY